MQFYRFHVHNCSFSYLVKHNLNDDIIYSQWSDDDDDNNAVDDSKSNRTSINKLCVTLHIRGFFILDLHVILDNLHATYNVLFELLKILTLKKN